MIKLKNLLNEGETKNPLINRLLVELKPLIDNIIEDTKKSYKKEDREFTKYDAYYTEIVLKYDMVRALEKYTLPTDKMSNVDVRNSSKGAFQIKCIIERDGNKYPFNTEVIYAGGYNIQKLHFRYLTKTTLPQTGQSAETQKLKAELSKLSKGEKLQKDIKFNETRIEMLQKEVEAASKLTDKQILDKIQSGDNIMGKPWKFPNWKELSDDGKKNYKNDENYFNQQKKEYEESGIDYWKKRNIGWKKQDIETSKKLIQKAQAKLDSLV